MVEMNTTSRNWAKLAIALLFFFGGMGFNAHSATPVVGGKAPAFTLKTVAGEAVSLPELLTKGKVVVVVLRGWPGYQCPVCTKQVAELLSRKEAFEKAGAKVLLVYPGPAEGLKQHAADFQGPKAYPDNFLLLLDPDYTFTDAYGIRWSASGETAYPSTFVLAQDGRVLFAEIIKSHGGRVPADRVLPFLN